MNKACKAYFLKLFVSADGDVASNEAQSRAIEAEFADKLALFRSPIVKVSPMQKDMNEP